MAKWDPPEKMKDLLIDARRQKLWLYCSYQNLWFSPDELEKEWNNGSFRWGPEMFRLEDPFLRLRELLKAVATARETADRFASRIQQSIEQQESIF